MKEQEPKLLYPQEKPEDYQPAESARNHLVFHESGRDHMRCSPIHTNCVEQSINEQNAAQRASAKNIALSKLLCTVSRFSGPGLCALLKELLCRSGVPPEIRVGKCAPMFECVPPRGVHGGIPRAFCVENSVFSHPLPSTATSGTLGALQPSHPAVPLSASSENCTAAPRASDDSGATTNIASSAGSVPLRCPSSWRRAQWRSADSTTRSSDDCDAAVMVGDGNDDGACAASMMERVMRGDGNDDS
ncbi:hypothetical protein C8J57DRAFT_1235534 [Mycena rebaudengoi]|nr:hypothetical protein C8J57DRAFT_1235534 [Mycena rebaudengoi]